MVDVSEAPEAKPNPYVPTSPDKDGLVVAKSAGMNTSVSRLAVSDDQLAWIDGFVPLDDMNLRAAPGVSIPFFTSPTLLGIVKYTFFNINGTPFCAVFLYDGSVWQFNTATGASTPIAPAGTITAPFPNTIGACAYGSQYLIFVASQTNGYYIWDGTTLYVPGGPGPIALSTMPLAIPGNAVAVYQGRIWVAATATIFFTAPGSLTDFSSLGGGGNFTSVDSFLTARFVQMVSVNGFLYLFGDSSINYISGVQTTGSPLVTTFTNQNADAQNGTPYPGSVELFGRNILFANSFGIHVLYGSDVKKVSKPCDGVYQAENFVGIMAPSSGQVVIFGRRYWCVLVRMTDPITQLPVNRLLMWDGDKKWWASNQDMPAGTELAIVAAEESFSTFTLWGSNGQAIFKLFTNPSALFTKRFLSKMWTTPGGLMTEKAAVRMWASFEYPSAAAPSAAINVELNNEHGSAFNQTVIIARGTATGFYVPDPIAVNQLGAMVGMHVYTDERDIVVNTIGIGEQIVGYRG